MSYLVSEWSFISDREHMVGGYGVDNVVGDIGTHGA